MRDAGDETDSRRSTHRASHLASRTDSHGNQDHRVIVSTPAPRRWWAFAVLLVAGFMDLVDVTIVNVALPSIQRDLQAPYVDLEWIVSGYVLGFAALLITGGRLGDLVGRRRILLIGLAGFTAASLACGMATDPAVLIGARCLQGAMAGLMVPQILSIVQVTFHNEERGKALGVWGAVMGAASVAGVLLGGVLVQWNVFDLTWRAIFLVNVPIGLIAIAGAIYLVPESRSATATRLDLTGTTLALAAVLLLVYPLIEGRSLGWPIWTYLLMVGSVAVAVIFVGYERRRTRTVGSPLVVLDLFRVRAFTVGMVVWGLFWIALGGFFLAWTLYLQAGLGWTPLHAGLTAAVFAVAAASGSGLSVQVFVPRFGRKVLLAGAVINAAGFGGYLWAAAHYGPAISSLEMALPLLCTGFGFGLVVAPMVDVILSDVPAPDAGSASGLLSTIQQVGMALGVALVGVVFFGQLAHNADNAAAAVVPSVHQQLSALGMPEAAQADAIAGFRACIQDRSAATDPTAIPASCHAAAPDAPAVAERLRPILTTAGLQANAKNFAHTFALTLWYGVALLIAVFAGNFALPNRIAQPSSIAGVMLGADRAR
jgi:EmrB/QacA subfamily drug resistance transporter